MILGEAVQDFDLDIVRLTADRLGSVVEDLVRVALICWMVLGEESIIDKPVDNLGLSNETGPQNADCLYVFFVTTLTAFGFLSHYGFYLLIYLIAI